MGVEISPKDLGIAQITLMSLGMLMNSALLLYFIGARKYRKSYHLAYMNLAVSDALIGMHGALWRGRAAAYGVPEGFWCYFGNGFGSLLITTNFMSVLPIAYDRFVAVMVPLRYNTRNHKLTLKLVIAFCWLASVIYWSSVAVALYVRYDDNRVMWYVTKGKFCAWHWTDWQVGFTLFMSVFSMYIPLVINIAVYSLIIWKLSRRAKIRSINSTVITIRAMIMCGIFMMTWIPGQVVVMSASLAKNMLVKQITHFILFLNCLTDPFIYTCSPSSIMLCLKKVKDDVSHSDMFHKHTTDFESRTINRSSIAFESRSGNNCTLEVLVESKSM